MSVSGTLRIAIDLFERVAIDLGLSSVRHTLDTGDLVVESGTGAGQFNLLWSDKRTASGAVDTIDLRGSLKSPLGTADDFVKVGAIFIRSKATVSGKVLSVGGAGANPAFAGLFGDASDKIKIGPGGVFAWYAPTDLLTTTAATADILAIDPGADTIEYEIVIAGRTV